VDREVPRHDDKRVPLLDDCKEDCPGSDVKLAGVVEQEEVVEFDGQGEKVVKVGDLEFHSKTLRKT
jgi:hypothetical protein